MKMKYFFNFPDFSRRCQNRLPQNISFGAWNHTHFSPCPLCVWLSSSLLWAPLLLTPTNPPPQLRFPRLFTIFAPPHAPESLCWLRPDTLTSCWTLTAPASQALVLPTLNASPMLLLKRTDSAAPNWLPSTLTLTLSMPLSPTPTRALLVDTATPWLWLMRMALVFPLVLSRTATTWLSLSMLSLPQDPPWWSPMLLWLLLLSFLSWWLRNKTPSHFTCKFIDTRSTWLRILFYTLVVVIIDNININWG